MPSAAAAGLAEMRQTGRYITFHGINFFYAINFAREAARFGLVRTDDLEPVNHSSYAAGAETIVDVHHAHI
jgi:hypothetical protein